MVPSVSVLMPCRNAEATIDEAVASMLAQGHDAFELIAYDDGSTDGTRRRLEAWASRDRRVRVVGGEHVGLVEALVRGRAACAGVYIARMDADDRADPRRLEAQVAYLEAHPEIAVAGSLVEGFPPGEVREGFRIYIEWLNGLVDPEAIAREIYIESPLAHPSVMMRADWLDRVGGYQDRGWPEDYDLWLRLHLAGAQLAKVPQTLLQWREHPGRATRTDPRYAVENFLRAKAHYLMLGPLRDRGAVFVWGAGQMGRRLSKHLVRGGAPLRAFIDIDPGKIGRLRRGARVIGPDDLPVQWGQTERPALLAAVGSRGARRLIRERLAGLGLVEGEDWWAVA
jgi:glycosyltransferase involved in cell wall biosynthesis